MLRLPTIVRQAAISGIVSVLAILCILQPAEAENPTGSVHQFYGTVTSNGKPVGAGYVVTATISGKLVASTTTDALGQWGYSPLFVVTSPCGTAIEFNVNGMLAGTASGCISTNRLDLVYNGMITTGSSTNTQSESIPSISSGGTITFFIGEQPSTSKSTNTAPAPTVNNQQVAVTPVTAVAVAELTATPQTVVAGDNVIITVKLLNRGNTEFTGGVVLRINDVVEQQKDVRLAIGESAVKSFNISKNDPGIYKASIDDYSTDFIVNSKPVVNAQQQDSQGASGQQATVSSGQEPGNNNNPLLPDSPILALAVLVAGAIIAIYLIYLIVRQSSSRY